MLAKEDTGFKIAQAGYDATNCADYQLLFNSAWPSLPIARDITVTVPVFSIPIQPVTIAHKLGFYPMAFAYVSLNGVYQGRAGISQDGEAANVELFIGKNNFYLLNNSLTNSYTVNVKAYNIDLTQQQDFTQPLPSGVKTTYNPNVGMKVTKSGQDITSTDLRDFILHTRAQSPAILSVITQASETISPTAGVNQISYTNPANYVNWIYAFSTSVLTPLEAGAYSSAEFTGQTFGITVSGSSYTLLYSPPADATLVVLRDPLVAPTNVQVTY